MSSLLANTKDTDDLKKRITAASESALPQAEKLLKKANAKKGGDLAKMKVAPRTLIASLEKYVSIPAEELIGEDVIDLDVDLDPVVDRVVKVAAEGAAELEKAEDVDPGEAKEKPARREESGELTHLILASGGRAPKTSPVADLSPSVDAAAVASAPQAVGMSFFERFALSAMVATEQHLSEASDSASDPETDSIPTTVQTVAAEVAPPVVIDQSDVVEMVKNDVPPVNVSPGLDEMVISSTSQTDFDLNDSEMTFLGNVQVKSPRFNLRADKFIVHLKKDNSGMAFGEAVGNVVIDLRENGQATGYSGLASNAIYYPEDGKIELSGWPKIRQQFKEHVAVTKDTKMILYTDGRVKTLGRNRTVIRN